MSLTRAARLGLALALAGMVLAGCPSWPDVEPCGQLPDVSACPVGRGGTCEDRECTALYDCMGGEWSLVSECPPVAPATSDPDGAPDDDAPCAAASVDRSGEALGCEPDLQEPDCPVSAAEGCRPCLTGCADFFLCTTPGWQVVAHCDEDGLVQLEP
ncbi:MAG: hypothetical protein RIF41_36745 [Polyangiaceae bacterium]